MAGRIASGSRQCLSAVTPPVSRAFCSGPRMVQCTRGDMLTASAAVIEKIPMLDGLMRPDQDGRFGKYGGKYVPETLIPALQELEKEYRAAMIDPVFQVCAIEDPWH